MKHLVAPSLLAANFGNLEHDIGLINNSVADWLHLDIMDGRFVPNISFGFPILKAVKSLSNKPMDVHLMIVQPEPYLERIRDHGAAMITVHVEACPHLHRTIQLIHATGAKAGVALNPHTPVSQLENVLEDIDMVLIMSVNPGYGGQKFIYQSLLKISQLKEMIISRNLKVLIEVDGGVGLQNAEKILQAGADVLVAGSSVFKADDPKEAIKRMKSIGVDTIFV